MSNSEIKELFELALGAARNRNTRRVGSILTTITSADEEQPHLRPWAEEARAIFRNCESGQWESAINQIMAALVRV